MTDNDRRDRRRAAGFSLTEVLAVSVIILIILTAVLPAWNGIRSSMGLSAGATMVTGQLDLARQTAMAENRQIEVRFYSMPARAGGSARYCALRRVRVENGRPIEGLHRLNPGIIFDPKYSTILSDYNNPGPDAKEEIDGQFYEYRTVRFLPNGSVTLAPEGADGDQWFVSLKQENASEYEGTPARNFATIQIDAVSGRCRLYRP